MLTQNALDVATFVDKFYKFINTVQTGRNPPYPENVIRDMFFVRLNSSIKTQLLCMGHESPNTLPTKWNELLSICITAENRARLNQRLEKKSYGSPLDKKRLAMSLRSFDQRNLCNIRHSSDSDSEKPNRHTRNDTEG